MAEKSKGHKKKKQSWREIKIYLFCELPRFKSVPEVHIERSNFYRQVRIGWNTVSHSLLSMSLAGASRFTIKTRAPLGTPKNLRQQIDLNTNGPTRLTDERVHVGQNGEFTALPSTFQQKFFYYIYFP